VNLEKTQILSAEEKLQSRNAALIGAVVAIILGATAFYTLLIGAANQLWSILPIFFASLALIWLSGIGRYITGCIVFIGVVALQTIVTPLVASGLGVPSAIASIGLIGILGFIAFPRRHIRRVLLAAISIAMAAILIDLFGPATRPIAEAANIRWSIAIATSVIFIIIFAREFLVLDIRTKIVLGILTTGGVALGVFGLFAVNRTGQITNSISGRLETSVKLLAEEQLANTVSSQADISNQFFNETMMQVAELAQYRISLQTKQAILDLGTYWDATTNLSQLSGGQYGNSPTDVSSVFVPVNTVLDEAMVVELNTSAYLDFAAPGILRSDPAVLAIYYIDPRGSTRYYPNINLASLIPPDFDATSRPYYKITAPLFNPRRLTRWTIPYVDAAGGGLVVTVAAPVYLGDDFHGVVAADIQLSKITEQVSSIKIGQTGYAFMIDDAGRIISMPPGGYAMFGINPQEQSPEDFFKQTVLGEGPDDLLALTSRMVVGGSGLNIIKVNGVDTYISYSPVKANGYSLALVVPVSEMQGALTIAHSETQNQVRSAIQLAAIIFAILLFAAILISLGIGQVISTPIIRLTQTANQIVAGDISAQATIASRDEIGTLARAFNTMTSRLRETLEGSEQQVKDRTADLVKANEQIERRAKQFESIARVSRVINQAQGLQDLLPQITQVISEQFGFYHVGIFLLDLNKEYAILVAANSEGGQRMLARNHKLKVGQVGIVGNVAGTGTPRIALDTGADAVYFNNPDLPETRSEIALPLFRTGTQPIGILDVQSTEANAFGQEDIQILSTLAEQVALAISNARLYEETQRSLIEAELLYRRDLQEGWSKFTRSQNLAGIRQKGMKVSLYSDPVELPGAAEVIRSGNKYQKINQTTQMTIPVKLRGEVVGILSVMTDDERTWTDDQMDIINAIVERAALSIESSRLLLESQKQAKKERVIGEIAAKVSSFTNRNNILQAAVAEIGRAMPGAEILIQLENKDGDGR